jgi:methylmalonyl-CoA/ethylmalonyl-CoA epimerase
MIDGGGDWMELPPPDAARARLMGAIGECVMDHVGVAVRDVDAAIARFKTLIGVNNWGRSRFRQDASYRGEKTVIGGNVATASLGPINVELVQPTEGSWTPFDFLRDRGEGIYHLGFRVPDVAAAWQRCEAAGLRVALIGVHAGNPLFTYSDDDDLFGVCVELVGPRMPRGMVHEFTEIP